MGAHFPTVELDNVIQFSILSKMSGFLRHSSKWACWFGHFLQYMSVFEVLVYSLDTDINYTIAILQLCLSLRQLSGWQLTGCILVLHLDYQLTKVLPLIDSCYISYTL